MSRQKRVNLLSSPRSPFDRFSAEEEEEKNRHSKRIPQRALLFTDDDDEEEEDPSKEEAKLLLIAPPDSEICFNHSENQDDVAIENLLSREEEEEEEDPLNDESTINAEISADDHTIITERVYDGKTYQVRFAITQEEKRLCRNASSKAMGILESATVFTSSKTNGVNSPLGGAEKKKASVQYCEEGEDRNDVVYLYAALKENISSAVEEIFQPRAADVPAVARVRFLSEENDTKTERIKVSAVCDRFFVTNQALFVLSGGPAAGISFFSELLFDAVDRAVVARRAFDDDDDDEEEEMKNKKKDESNIYFSLASVPSVLRDGGNALFGEEKLSCSADFFLAAESKRAREIVLSSMRKFTFRATREPNPEYLKKHKTSVSASRRWTPKPSSEKQSALSDGSNNSSTAARPSVVLTTTKRTTQAAAEEEKNNNIFLLDEDNNTISVTKEVEQEQVQRCLLESEEANQKLVKSLYRALFQQAPIHDEDGENIQGKRVEDDILLHDMVSEAFSSSLFDSKTLVSKCGMDNEKKRVYLKSVVHKSNVTSPCFGVSPENADVFEKALDTWSKARYSPQSRYNKSEEKNNLLMHDQRAKVIMLASSMNSISLDAVVAEICREMKSEEEISNEIITSVTFLAASSRADDNQGNCGGIYLTGIDKHENSAHVLLLKLASFGIYPIRGTYDVSLFDKSASSRATSSSSGQSALKNASFEANVLFIATFRKRNFKIVNTLSHSHIAKLIEIEREAWIACPEMCTAEDTIRDRVLNNQAMNFAVFKIDTSSNNDMSYDNDSALLKGMMYTQFVKNTADVSERNCWATKESARLEPFTSSTIQLLDVFADQRFSLENGGDVGMQLRDFVLHFAERIPIVKKVCAVTRTRGFREAQQRATKKIEESKTRGISEHLKASSLSIPTYKEHVLSEEGGKNDRGLLLHVGAGAKILKVQYDWRPQDFENDKNGVLIEYEVEKLSWKRYSNVLSENKFIQ
jgi:hypothetical protein